MNKILNKHGYIFIESIAYHLNMYNNNKYIYLFHDTSNNLITFISCLDNQEAINFFNNNTDYLVWFKNSEIILNYI